MQSVRAAIDRRAEDIIAVGEEIRRHPGLGFIEFKTSRLVAQTFERMGLAPRTDIALAGVRADAAGLVRTRRLFSSRVSIWPPRRPPWRLFDSYAGNFYQVGEHFMLGRQKLGKRLRRSARRQ